MSNEQKFVYFITGLAVIVAGCVAPEHNYALSITPTIYLSATPEVLTTNTPAIEVFTQTPTPEFPDSVIASEDEKENARKILQEYYSVLPYLNETTSYVYHEYHGCVGTNDVFGVLSYDTVYSLETVKNAFKNHFQLTNWEYTEKNYSDTWLWSSYNAKRVSTDVKPLIETIYLRIYKWPPNLEETDTIKAGTRLEVYIEHIENTERYHNRETQYFYSICEFDWWLWIGP